jgi:AraC-like DNA-binding protein
VKASPERPYLCFFLKLDLVATRQLVVDHHLPMPSRQSSDRGISTGSATHELFDAFSRLLAIADKPKDIPILRPLIHREILYRLLTGEQGTRFREIASLGSQSHRTALAVNWLRSNYAQPLRINELAKSVKMGVSTLHHQFRAMTSMSPFAVSKAVAVTGSPKVDADRELRCRKCSASGWLRECNPIQYRIQPFLRSAADAIRKNPAPALRF